jgi:beta-glucanase (GH16 family)
MSPGIVVARAPRDNKRAAGDEWRLVWSDEFDGHRLDPDKWDFDLGNGFQDPVQGAWIPGWGQGELQTYTQHPDNVAVHDGVLSIRALKQAHEGCSHTSARIKTRRRDGQALFAQCHGRFEFRARVPWGKGLCPALRLLPLDDRDGGWAASGEIDVMAIAGEKPNEVLNSIHFGSSFPARSLLTHVHPLPSGSTVADWHVYVVEWEPGEIRFYVDEVLTCTRRFWWSCSVRDGGQGIEARRLADLNPWPAPFDQPFCIVMSVAVGGHSPGAPNETTQFPAELLVDYVRVYDKAGGYGETPPRGRGRFPWHKKP